MSKTLWVLRGLFLLIVALILVTITAIPIGIWFIIKTWYDHMKENLNAQVPMNWIFHQKNDHYEEEHDCKCGNSLCKRNY